MAGEEPAIVSVGRSFIGDYSPKEFKDSLDRAFNVGGADFITLDSNLRGQKFLAACGAWGLDEGLLYNDSNQDDGQQVVSSFRLTKKGKKEILGQ